MPCDSVVALIVSIKQPQYPLTVIEVKRIIQTEPALKIIAIRTVFHVKYV